MSTFEVISLWFGAAALVIAAATAGLGLYQLHQLVAQVKAAVQANTLSQLDALLQMERNLADSRNELAKAALKVAAYSGKETGNQDFERTNMEYNEAKQTHFNAVDRLCATILRGLLDEAPLRPEYRDYISGLVNQYPTDFGTTTPYRSTMKLYNKWAES